MDERIDLSKMSQTQIDELFLLIVLTACPADRSAMHRLLSAAVSRDMHDEQLSKAVQHFETRAAF